VVVIAIALTGSGLLDEFSRCRVEQAPSRLRNSSLRLAAHAIAVRATDLQRHIFACGGREPRFPLAETVFTLVATKLCRLPGCAAIERDVHARDAGVAAECSCPSFASPPYYGAQFSRLRAKRGPKKALCAVAASMLTAIYHMLKDGTHHQDLGADHFDRRSSEAKATHHMAQLAKLGFHVELQPVAHAA
jgi:hypothetical protein